MRLSPRTLVAVAAGIAVAGGAAAVVPTAAADSDVDTQLEHHEVFHPDGSISHAEVSVPVGSPAPAADVAEAEVTPIIENGPSEDKYDIVVVGDGYTEADLDVYDQHVRDKVDHLFSVEPFAGYESQFNVWKVDVVSNESGVSNDPDEGVERDTAMDMHFYCGGMDRLLCVDTVKANQFAAAAPDVDQVLALANSDTYGGAGGEVATSSGGHDTAGDIVVHEFGHSIGGLADEYDYGEDGHYDGDEVPEENVSIHDRETQETEQLKWHEWMGEESPDGGTVDVYDGARYYESGIYRPTEDSIMRSLGNEFNLPGLEVMIGAFHDVAAVATPAVDLDAQVAHGAEVGVQIPDLPGGHEITWTVDGEPIAAAADQTSLDTGILSDDSAEVTVTVVDATESVRDEALRADKLTVEFTWQLQ